MLPEAPLPRPKVVDVAVHTLREQILSGRYSPGDSLPPERSLCHELGISRLTLRAALARLEGEGLVKPLQGSGTRVLNYRESGGVELLGSLLTLTLGGDGAPLTLLEEVLELRRLLAIEAFGLAAERATVEELDALEGHLANQARHVDTPRAFMEHDIAFARRLIQSTRNFPLQLLFNTIARTILTRPGIEQLFVVTSPRLTLAFYGRLLGHLRARDAVGVRHAARKLIARHDHQLLLKLSHLTSAVREPFSTPAPDTAAHLTEAS